jgi:ubiquinone biosynthesis protein UbiJ
MAPEIVAVIISVVVSSTVSIFMAERTARREFERDIQRVRTEFMAERVARELLSDSRWKKRSFKQIERTLGGFQGDDLRRILVRAGAIRFFHRRNGGIEEEFWGLRERIQQEIEKAEDDD